MGFKYGLMVPNTKVNGSTTRPMEKVHFGMCTVISILENGAMTKLKGKASTHMLTGQSMTENGRMTYSMAMVLRYG